MMVVKGCVVCMVCDGDCVVKMCVVCSEGGCMWCTGCVVRGCVVRMCVVRMCEYAG